MTAPAPRLYRLTKPSRSELSELSVGQSRLGLSYRPVGISLRSADPPPELTEVHVQRRIGSGSERFDQARSAIIDWAGHRNAGARLQPEQPELAVGNVVALALRVWPLWVTATCRIVDIVDEPNRFGFAYGTLPHHPAAGEESFVVVREPSTDQVRLEITAYSRPASRLARMGGPISRALQRLTATRYLDGFEHHRSDAEPVRPPFAITSTQWWFQNRNTGRFTIAQFPNWPLFAIGAAIVARRLSTPEGPIHQAAGIAIPVLWLYWGAGELLQGVNPWRRLLGLAVIGWQAARLLA